MVLAVSEFGDGRPLVILHGLFGSRDNWHTIANRLADIRRVVTVDLPNHGDSPHIDAFDYDVMAQAVRDTAERLELEGLDLMGHSMGGKAAMRFAQRFPEHVSSLVIVDIAPIDYPTHSHAEIIAGMRAVRLHEVDSRRDADVQMAERIPNKAIRSFLLKNLVRTNDRYAWRLNIDAIESNYQAIRGYPKDGKPFEGRSLFIAGERSDYINARAREAIVALVPNAEVSTISGAGHWLHSERQDEFVDRLRKFLQER